MACIHVPLPLSLSLFLMNPVPRVCFHGDNVREGGRHTESEKHPWGCLLHKLPPARHQGSNPGPGGRGGDSNLWCPFRSAGISFPFFLFCFQMTEEKDGGSQAGRAPCLLRAVVGGRGERERERQRETEGASKCAHTQRSGAHTPSAVVRAQGRGAHTQGRGACARQAGEQAGLCCVVWMCGWVGGGSSPSPQLRASWPG